MDKDIEKVESYLTKIDRLNNQAATLKLEMLRAQQAGEIEACKICNKNWQTIRMAVNFLNQQIENQLMFRLPPISRRI